MYVWTSVEGCKSLNFFDHLLGKKCAAFVGSFSFPFSFWLENFQRVDDELTSIEFFFFSNAGCRQMSGQEARFELI